jgi:hypothetical protein
MWFFAIGVLFGVVGTVMFLTLTDLPGRRSNVNAAIGDARVVLAEAALEQLIEIALAPELSPGTPVKVTVAVLDTGLLEVNLLVGPLGVQEDSRLVLDPEILDGSLSMLLVESEGTVGGAPPLIVPLIEAPLRRQLDALAMGLPYRLSAISTRDSQLTLEIEF